MSSHVCVSVNDTSKILDCSRVSYTKYEKIESMRLRRHTKAHARTSDSPSSCSRFQALSSVMAVFFDVAAVVSNWPLFSSRPPSVDVYSVREIAFDSCCVSVVRLLFVRELEHCCSRMVIEQVLYPHRDDIVLKDPRANEREVWCNTYFDHGAARQQQHAKNNQYLDELKEEAREYRPMVMRSAK